MAFGSAQSRVVLPLGGITALIGANDAGKSTLLRAVQSMFVAIASGDARHVRVSDPCLALRGKRRLRVTLVDSMDHGRLTQHSDSISSLTDRPDVDIVIRKGAELTTWLAAPAGFVLRSELLAKVAAAEGIDLASYPGWMPVPLFKVSDDVPETLRSLVPSSLQLPLPEEELVLHVNQAVERLLRAFTSVRRCAAEGYLEAHGVAAMPECMADELRDWVDSPGADPWLYPAFAAGGHEEVVHPDLIVATWAFSNLLHRALPEFISDEYECQIQPSRLSEWIRRGDRTIIAMRKRSHSTAFTSDQFAEGFKLWLQLSVLDAASDIHTLATWLEEAFSSGQQTFGGLDSEAWLHDIKPAVDALAELRIVEQADHEPLNESGLSEQALELLSNSCSPLADHRGLEDLGRSAVSVAILDEPERQLHPRLQRVATGWLVSRAQKRSARYVLATHSIAFMGLAPTASFFHVRRDPTGSPEAIPIDPQALSATDAVADELGWDRGELLAFVEEMVFVEGITDKVFIEELYGIELRRRGVLLVALGGATKTQSVIPMTEVLMRFTTRPVKVILDDVPVAKFERLKSDSDFRKEAMRDRQVELRELAKLVQAAIELERDVVGVAISTKDIFDLVDEGVVAQSLALPGKSPFPGHQAARALVGESKWKQVYLDSYGLDILDPRTFARAGAEMRRRGLAVPELRMLLDLADRP